MHRPDAFLTNFVTFVLRHKVGVSTAFTVLGLDQIAKVLIIFTLAVGDSWPHSTSLRLTHVTNTGSTFDLFSGHTTILIAMSAIGIALVFGFYWSRARTGARAQVTFGLMLAGCAGNLADRLVLGHVTDFIDILPWFIFNVADVSILLGLLGFLWDIPNVMSQHSGKSISQNE